MSAPEGTMRWVLTLLVAFVWLIAPAFAAPPRAPEFTSRDAILNWIWKLGEGGTST
jgi:hypothetical protein